MFGGSFPTKHFVYGTSGKSLRAGLSVQILHDHMSARKSDSAQVLESSRTIQKLYNIMTWIKDRWPKCLIYNDKSCNYVFRGGTKGAGQVAPPYSTRLILSSNYSRHEVCFSSTSQRHTSRWIGVYIAPRWVCECVCACVPRVLRMGSGSTATLTMNGCVRQWGSKRFRGRRGRERGKGRKEGVYFLG